MIKIFSLSLLLAFTAPLFAQQLNVPKGKEFSYSTHLVSSGTIKYDHQHTYTFKSLGKNADGDNIFECTITRTVIGNPGRSTSLNINTDKNQDTQLNSTAPLDTWAILQQPFKVIINDKGKVVSYEGLDETLMASAKRWNLTQGEVDRVMGHKGLITSNVQKMFFQVPDGPQDTQAEWHAKNGTVYKIAPQLPQIDLNKEVKQPFKNDAVTPSLLKITFESTSFTHEKGFYIIDAQTGLIVKANTNSEYDSNYSSIKNHYKDDYTVVVNNDAPDMRADTAWINMAIKMSQWSDALKTNKKNDLVKMEAFFKANDAKFADDPYYRINKLNAYQRLVDYNTDSHGTPARTRYDSALLATPSKVLYLETDLHTQLSNQFLYYSRNNAQKAYEVAKFFYKTDTFYEQLQEFTAQQFLGDGEKRSAQQNISIAFVNLMMADKDPAFRTEIKPLYLWASAKMAPGDQALLLKNATQLANMDKQAMQTGKGGRYAMLVYKMLLEAGKKTEANKLLDATIDKLQAAVADTTYKYRVDDKYALAYAWYLKYEAQKTANDPSALQSLSMAAQNSPSGPIDHNYMRGYDMHFLKSKPSYRQDFIEALFNSGNEQQALKTFAAHISAEPDNLLQMKSLYEQTFPGKDFKKVFEKDIIGSWANAPEFALKDLDDKEHQSAEHFNKWTVIDFWGSWCGPCQAEAPAIDKFSKEVADSKTMAFVSIACRDWRESLVPFMHRFNYTFPVLMSDNHIEKKYKVTAYPYKVLVSPAGKMIPIEYGKDWQSILKTFSSI